MDSQISVLSLLEQLASHFSRQWVLSSLAETGWVLLRKAENTRAPVVNASEIMVSRIKVFVVMVASVLDVYTPIFTSRTNHKTKIFQKCYSRQPNSVKGVKQGIKYPKSAVK